jgi:hypothetical protein
MNKNLHDIGWITTGHPTPSRAVLDAKSHLEAAARYNATPEATATRLRDIPIRLLGGDGVTIDERDAPEEARIAATRYAAP